MATLGVVLGHIISRDGIQVDPTKIELISKLPSPTTIKEDKQGVDNVVADHLSQVKVESHFKEAKINDEFPDDALCAVEKLPWFTNIVNYLATGELPS
ncbi:hypothetical protein CK203_054207 [Vitis vinifera]|uniref:Uncharacterized protein n=1 Tax=Vitis vinifera TaxID=29760 RepID=A0A438HGH5_VITVI|nr:hypothetical protein CK203_054207 [Vitis vinifera]